jgi:hypothetical protein
MFIWHMKSRETENSRKSAGSRNEGKKTTGMARVTLDGSNESKEEIGIRF